MKLVICMRTDLSMRKGKMVAQGAHAAVMPLLELLNVRHPDYCVELGKPYMAVLDEWIAGGMKKICVGVGSLDELDKLERAAAEYQIWVNRVTDAGLTEFGGVPTVTCAAFGPAPDEEMDEITGHLNLL